MVGRAGDTATRVGLKVEERRRERRAGLGVGVPSGSEDGVGDREEDDVMEGEGEKGEKYTGDGTRTGGTGITESLSRREPNSVSVGVHTGVVTGTSLR